MATALSFSTPALTPLVPLLDIVSPQQRKPRMIVLCFDGTGNEFSDANTNVIKLYSLLRKDEDEDQVCYYQGGIGANFTPGIARPLFRSAMRIPDQAFATYLSQHVLGGYRFLMTNYEDGDRISMFGFSRGAYTARVLAGMLHKVGLLPRHGIEQARFAYELYRSRGSKNEIIAQDFKKTFCRDVHIEFVGVWDTVASVGVVMTRSLPHVECNSTIRVFRQALSLDEHRAKFRPKLRLPNGRPSRTPDPNRHHQKEGLCETDVKEVWFAGCHSDVGGGVALNTTRHCLSNISLRWMVDEIMRADCHILFDFDAFEQLHIPRAIGQNDDLSQPDGQRPHRTDEPREDNATEDEQDAVQKATDELKYNPLWWLPEILPISYTYQNRKGKWVTEWWPHFGRGRKVPPNPLFHTSVKIRMNDPKLKYKPRARYKKGTETYVS